MNKAQIQILRRNPIFLIGLVIFFISVLVSVGGSLIRPDNTAFANAQYLELSTLKPLTTVKYLIVNDRKRKNEQSMVKNHFIGAQQNLTLIPYDSIGIKDNRVILKR